MIPIGVGLTEPPKKQNKKNSCTTPSLRSVGLATLVSLGENAAKNLEELSLPRIGDYGINKHFWPEY